MTTILSICFFVHADILKTSKNPFVEPKTNISTKISTCISLCTLPYILSVYYSLCGKINYRQTWADNKQVSIKMRVGLHFCSSVLYHQTSARLSVTASDSSLSHSCLLPLLMDFLYPAAPADHVTPDNSNMSYRHLSRLTLRCFDSALVKSIIQVLSLQMWPASITFNNMKHSVDRETEVTHTGWDKTVTLSHFVPSKLCLNRHLILLSLVIYS